MFEIKRKDGLARIGILEINGRRVETPNIAVVVNPNRMVVDIEFLKKIGASMIITNAYIIRNSKFKEDILSQGLHDFFDFDGIIYTDSGTFQMYSKGEVDITNEETIKFQHEIGSDLITPLDVFTLPTDGYNEAFMKYRETKARIDYLHKYAKERDIHYVFPIQGGMHLSLRKSIAKDVSSYKPAVVAIGGIVPLMESYKYKDLLSVVLSVKESLKHSLPLHAFGAGHPMIFPLLVYAGIDIFDSASYALYAKDGRYITETRTLNIKDLEYLPCSCEVCSSLTPKEMGEKEVAKHNIIKIFEEIKRIKEHIRRGELENYVEQRIGSHPELVKAYRLIKKEEYAELLKRHVSSTKRASVFWVRNETALRPLFEVVKRKLSFVNSSLPSFRWFKGINVPLSLALTYPFGQFQYVVSYEKHKEKLKNIIAKEEKDILIGIVRDILAYQLETLNIYDVSFEGYNVIVSKTSRIKYLSKNDKVMATLRAEDNVFVLSKDFAKMLYEKGVLNKAVVVSDEAVPFIEDGRNVFNKFVVSCKGIIQPNDVVAVVDETLRFLNVGFARLSCEEMTSLNRGVGVDVR